MFTVNDEGNQIGNTINFVLSPVKKIVENIREKGPSHGSQGYIHEYALYDVNLDNYILTGAYFDSKHASLAGIDLENPITGSVMTVMSPRPNQDVKREPIDDNLKNYMTSIYSDDDTGEVQEAHKVTLLGFRTTKQCKDAEVLTSIQAIYATRNPALCGDQIERKLLQEDLLEVQQYGKHCDANTFMTLAAASSENMVI